METFKNNIVT